MSLNKFKQIGSTVKKAPVNISLSILKKLGVNITQIKRIFLFSFTGSLIFLVNKSYIKKYYNKKILVFFILSNLFLITVILKEFNKVVITYKKNNQKRIITEKNEIEEQLLYLRKVIQEENFLENLLNLDIRNLEKKKMAMSVLKFVSDKFYNTIGEYNSVSLDMEEITTSLIINYIFYLREHKVEETLEIEKKYWKQEVLDKFNKITANSILKKSETYTVR